MGIRHGRNFFFFREKIPFFFSLTYTQNSVSEHHFANLKNLISKKKIALPVTIFSGYLKKRISGTFEGNNGTRGRGYFERISGAPCFNLFLFFLYAYQNILVAKQHHNFEKKSSKLVYFARALKNLKHRRYSSGCFIEKYENKFK